MLLWRRVLSWERITALALMCSGVLIVLLLTAPTPTRLTTQLASDSIESGQGRVYIAKRVLPLIGRREWFGWGKNQLLGHIASMHPNSHTAIMIDTAHNEPMQVAFDSGLVGLAFYLLVWTTALRRAPPALFAALLGYAAWLLSSWSQLGAASVAWVFLGLAVADTPATPWAFTWRHLRRDVRL